MTQSWDQFAKEVLPTVLAGLGEVDTGVEVHTDAQCIDVVVTPRAELDWDAAFEEVGWLARMVERPALIEPYSTTAGVEKVRDCLRRQFTLLQMRRNAAEKQAEGLPRRQVEVPQLWLLSAGDARSATEGFGLATREDWPEGFRFSAPALGLCLVILPKLPKTRATLALRLLGRGRTLADAVAEVRELPPDDRLRGRLTEVMAQRRFVALYSTDPEDRTEAEMLQQEWQRFKDQVRKEGLDAGRKEGRDEGRDEARRRALHQLTRRFGELPDWARDHVANASDAELDRLAEALLDAPTLEAAIRG